MLTAMYLNWFRLFKILENKNLFQILGYILNRFLYRGGLPGKF